MSAQISRDLAHFRARPALGMGIAPAFVMVPHAARTNALPSAALSIGVLSIHVYGALAPSQIFAHAAQRLSALAARHLLRGLRVHVRAGVSQQGPLVRVDIYADQESTTFLLRRTRASLFDALDAAITTLGERLGAPMPHLVANDNAID